MCISRNEIIWSQEYDHTTLYIKNVHFGVPGITSASVFSFTHGGTSFPLTRNKYIVSNETLYIGELRAHPVHNITYTETPIVDATVLGMLHHTWGVCDTYFHFKEIPRHCRQRDPISIHCTPLMCPVSFTRAQHVATQEACENKYIPIGINRIPINCDAYIDVTKSVQIPAVIIANENIISMWQSKISFEYDTNQQHLRLWPPLEENDTFINGIIPAVLINMYIMWISWSHNLNSHITNFNTNNILKIWIFICIISMPIADIALWAVSIKINSFVFDHRVFAPEAIDAIAGVVFTIRYSFFYIGASALAATCLCCLLFVMYRDYSARKLPSRSCWFTYIQFIPEINITSQPDTAARILILIRLINNFIFLTSIHISIPPEFGEKCYNLVGLLCGLTLVTTTGRDANFLFYFGNNIERISIVAFVILCWFQGIVFMIYPIFHIIPTLSPKCKFNVTQAVFCVCVGGGVQWGRYLAESFQRLMPTLPR